MIKKIVYTISIISLIILTAVTKDMLPFIYQSKLQGMLFLILVIMLLIGELYCLIKYKKAIKKNYIYNGFLILTTTYITVIYYKMYSSSLRFIYSIDISYLKNMYSLLSLVFLIMIFDLGIVIKEYKDKTIS